LIERSKKKLEKSLVDAKNELNDLTSRLEIAQTGKIISKQKMLIIFRKTHSDSKPLELTERDEKIETLIAQLELKREFMKVTKKFI